ncbi:Uncharacterized protein dnm_092640 [Desulfonema magnum]|uniref:Uncharacterized protein n=1 Tax=Desulfonema magnum TaxID=45655 RepID=A0A975BX48_9BACT|nr:Uncharacterized protein dnm_092640 [Desulfonema magnum]
MTGRFEPQIRADWGNLRLFRLRGDLNRRLPGIKEVSQIIPDQQNIKSLK